MKKKVFLFIPTIGGGGAEKIVLDLAAGIDKDRYNVELVSLYDESHATPSRKKYAEDKGIRIRYMNKRSGFDIKLLFNLIKLVKQEKPDVLHSHIESFQYVFVVGSLLRLKHIHTMHSIGGKEHGIYVKLLKTAYKNKKFYMVALSNAIYGQLSEMYPELGSRLKIIFNGVDIERFKSQKQSMNGDHVEYICVANLTEVKNHKMLLHSFRKVVDSIKNAHLTLVGDGILRAEIEALTEELELQNNVTFEGSVSDPASFLEKSDVFVMSSHYEGMPLSVAEAMAAGLPIVVPRIGGLPEMVTDNGILYTADSESELTDAMIKIGEDSALWEKAHKESLKRAKMFDVYEMINRYEELYGI